ncbi:hemophore-related protein [Nocardia takedensis]|uniref:hemophore-related protein n=1 Tax=Nocardia takedensis TaxID=259390 RepID=UPI00030BC5A6|nr:hemophore-related protein [Nocardia takedensis]
MAQKRTRGARVALALGAIAAAALLAPGTAAAQPGPHGKLIETDCTFAQIDAALHATAPDFAARLDAHPGRKAKFAEFFALPVEQRRARVEQRFAEHPDARQKFEERRGEGKAKILRETLDTLADTCHNY